ncbi:thioredoxin domain-containing protein [Saccharopolyspora sp. ID03-671]|uniref:DsbA family protein n=1 Tax=Saccharopolyspora sp. ID03-671 TaxID=3073066 RepID=UPI00324E0A56
MTTNLKLSVLVATVATIVVAVLLVATRPSGPSGQVAEPAPSAPVPAEVLVRPDSHKLSTAPDGAVTVVEFLDLECEACRAAFPVVEQLRQEYAGRVTFVMRYFPIPSHRNSDLAARSVEAAGQQGKLEEMYRKMYETQAQWGDQQVDHRATFVGFARELGLDVATFEAALDAPTTAERVQADFREGINIGVEGTPTFFVNGRHLSAMPTYETLRAAIERELATSPR